MASASGSNRLDVFAAPKAKPTMAISSLPPLSPITNAPLAKHGFQFLHGAPGADEKQQEPTSDDKKELAGDDKEEHACDVDTGPDSEGPQDVQRLKSLELLAQWNARWSDEHVRSKEWPPERNMIVIAGRSVGVLIVSTAV